ncbi:MAG: DsrE/DsrF/DrsH-like family protein [Bacteroidales bacterium]|jgi:NADPH-dependent 2,4-dienoyl-CoA reductase/sulfur reductase-like enzyme/peroxiredoxin family protein/rhodanese-related sulfurtransferase/TusA-related sulfurtransferase
MKYLIIGGVAGGATTAARLRRVDEKAEIILIEKGKYISYANCGLPYYIGGTIKNRDRLFVQTPEKFYETYKVDVRIENEVLKINREEKSVLIKDANGNEYIETYDKLILSTGSYAFTPPLPGLENEGVFTLRNVTDTDNIKNYLDIHNCKSAVVVGAGFIGLEMVENLHDAGLNVSVVEMTDQVMPPIDFSMASIVHQHLLKNNVNLFLNETVIGIEKKEGKLHVNLKSDKSIPADIVIMSIGVRSESKLAVEAGLETNPRGAVVVNECLQTKDENIYAIGDVIQYPHPLTNIPWSNFLAGPANRQGRIVADNIVFGNNIKYEGAIGTSIAKVFDLTVASTGMAEKQLIKDNIDYITSTTHSASNASYYPGACTLTIKICFSPKNGQLFGCQIVGRVGVDKRIDQAALVIKNKGTIYDLIKIEQAYAPPYSSAKDPIAIAGYVADNILHDRVKVVSWRKVKDADLDKITLIDVRTLVECETGAIIPGSVNIPLNEIRDRLDEIPKNKPVYVYCRVGLRGYIASRILKQNGFEVYNLSGGYLTYQMATAPIVNKKHEDQVHSSAEHTTPIKAFENKNADMIYVDACGMQCPGPLLKLKKSVDDLKTGEILQISATDPGFIRDAQSWCNSTGNTFLSSEEQEGKYIVKVAKDTAGLSKDSGIGNENVVKSGGGNDKTFIMFSDSLDKALATFVLANGAAATGKKVTIFFTFWGLNVIKKENKPKVEKDFFGKMFSKMLPSNSKKLKLSKFNMWGMGSKMMRNIMKQKNIDSLESLRQQAIDSGVEFIACQMSMDVMGVKKEELLDNVTVGGVATYMNKADSANVNLFI